MRLLLMLGFLLCSMSSPGAATLYTPCHCPESNLQSEARRNTAVFVGEVVISGWGSPHVAPSPTDAAIKDPCNRVAVVRVYQAWRGVSVGDLVRVFTSCHPGECGRDFLVGARYLFFSTRHDNTRELTDSNCSATELTVWPGDFRHVDRIMERVQAIQH
jgi:hypothetical protein